MILIQSLYDPRTPLPSDLDFYKQALEEIELFAISSQVYVLLNQNGILSRTPSFFRDRLKQKYSETLSLNIFIKNQTYQLLNTFEELGMDVIPLKGTMFTEKYFGHLGARSTSDIDLLIKRVDLENAIKCVKSLGYSIEQERIPSHFHISFSKPLPCSPIPLTIELHWDLLKENTANLNIMEFWNQASPIKNSLHIKELSDYHTFYMICLHGWRHNLDSLKYFLDIIQMIHLLKDKLDFNILLKDALLHKTYRRIIRTLSIVFHQFPHLEEIKKFPHKRSTLWWEYDAIKNKKARTFKNYVDFLDYQFFSYDNIKHSLVNALSNI